MPAAMAVRQYPFPFRTRKSSSLAPMILGSPGKVGSCQLFFNFFIFYTDESFAARLFLFKFFSLSINNIEIGYLNRGISPCVA